VPPVGVAAMWAALLTLAAKEGLFRYMLAKAERLRSPMLVANAWHARADALSSLVVAAGIAGALLGFNFADAVAAIIVGAMIVRAGFSFAWAAIRELIDTGLSSEEVEAIRQTIAGTPASSACMSCARGAWRTRCWSTPMFRSIRASVSPKVIASPNRRGSGC
jgi:divalent metal cation (Fe/Co/Zn/Cd) transporter